MDHFFAKFSKFILIFPLIILAVGLILKSKNITLGYNQKNTAVNQQSAIIPTVTPTPKPKKIAFDLQGPLVCGNQGKDSSISAFIKNKQIVVRFKQGITEDDYLVKGDCLYSWTKNTYVGIKRCGVSSLLSMAETLSKLGMVDYDTIFSMLPQTKSLDASSTAMLKQVGESCHKEQIEDTIFTIPSTISFKVAPLPSIKP